MNFLYEFIYAYPLVSLAQLAFTVWMAVDAYRRHVEQFWYWIILFIPVLGPWVYFFAIVAPHLASGRFPGALFQRRASVSELRYRAGQSPTLANLLALGQCLTERGEYAEALPILEGAHKIEPEHGQV